MPACKKVKDWYTNSILLPAAKLIYEQKQKCDVVRTWVDAVYGDIETTIKRQEKRCKKLPWWNPLRWLCTLFVIFEKVFVWGILIPAKWTFDTICKMVTTVVAIVAGFVLRAAGAAVSVLVCAFSDPLEALRSLADLWSALLKVADEAVELVRAIVRNVGGVLNDVDQLIDSVVDSAGWLGLPLGLFKGLTHFGRDVLGMLDDAAGAGKDIVLGTFGGDPCRISRGLADLGTTAVRGLLNTGFAPLGLLVGPGTAGALLGIRVSGYIIAGERDVIDLLQLAGIIRSSITNGFAGDSPRIERNLNLVGVDGGLIGLVFTCEARRMYLNSRSRTVDLRKLHHDGVVDIFGFAGYPSRCGRLINEAEGEVVYAGTDVRVSYSDIAAFLKDGAGACPEFHVYAITRAKFSSHLQIAIRKARAVGIRLVVPNITPLEAYSLSHIPLDVGEVKGTLAQEEIFRTFDRTEFGDHLAQIPSINHFHYILEKGREPFGITSWYRPSAQDARVSGVSYRNRSPDFVFRWVLVHELGHYWGLKHSDREGKFRGLDEIMFSPVEGDPLSVASFYEYLLGGSEPRFTLDDARTTWDWITTDGKVSLLP